MVVMRKEPHSARPPGEMEDREIVIEVLSGNDGLYELLMRRYNQRVYRTVLGIVGNRDDAEDAVQHAWIEGWRNLASFEERASFSTWITKIALHAAYARIRKQKHPVASLGPDRPLISSDQSSPEVDAMNSQLRELLEQEVLALPGDSRIVLTLRDVEGLSTSEAAEVLGVTEGVVRTRLHRARSVLRQRLERLEAREMRGLMAFAGRRCDTAVTAVLEAIRRESASSKDCEMKGDFNE